MTNLDIVGAGYILKVVLRNSSGGELDARYARNDDEVKEHLIDIVTNDVICVGDKLSVEEA